VGDSALVEVGGNVGIGTTNPGQRFVVKGGNTNDFLIDNDGSQYTEIDIANNGATKVSNYWDNVNSVFTFSLSSSTNKWNFLNGNVGIGTPNPTAKLHVIGDTHVTGNATVDGNIAAKYQDVAEWVEAATPLEPGTIVIVD